jgi:hypothetical protein
MVNARFHGEHMVSTRASIAGYRQAGPDGIIRSHFSKKCGSFVLNKRKKANAAFNAMR